MPRAYLRLDPAFDERKESYPDGPYATLIATFCLAELQPTRGRFRSLDYLTRLLGRRGRHVPYLLQHGDIATLDDGRIYVDGWDEWQEGDWKVAERVSRIRNRKTTLERITLDDTPPVTVVVTPGVTPSVTVGDTAARQSVSGGGASSGAVSEAGAVQVAPDPWEDPEHEALVWLNRHGCDIRPGNGYHQQLVTAVERHGVNAIVGMFDKLAKAGTRNGDLKGFLFPAIDSLDKQSRPSLTQLDRADRADDERAAFQRRLAKTRADTAELRSVLPDDQLESRQA